MLTTWCLVRKALLDESIPEKKTFPLKAQELQLLRSLIGRRHALQEQMIEEVAKVLKDASADVFALEDQGIFENLSEWNIEVSGYEFARTLAHERRLAFNKLSEILRDGRMADGFRVAFLFVSSSKENLELLRIKFDGVLNEIDFIICPSAQSAAPKGLDSTGSADFNIWTSLHCPAISLLAVLEKNTGLP